jgi:hypothetical protein
MMLPRDGLIDRILGRTEPVVVLDAAAGMGKSMLLAEISSRSRRPVHFGEDAAPGRFLPWSAWR